MAFIGTMLGKGYVQGLGPVTIYQDMDDTDQLFVYTEQGIRYYMNRKAVQWRKQ